MRAPYVPRAAANNLSIGRGSRLQKLNSTGVRARSPPSGNTNHSDRLQSAQFPSISSAVSLLSPGSPAIPNNPSGRWRIGINYPCTFGGMIALPVDKLLDTSKRGDNLLLIRCLGNGDWIPWENRGRRTRDRRWKGKKEEKGRGEDLLTEPAMRYTQPAGGEKGWRWREALWGRLRDAGASCPMERAPLLLHLFRRRAHPAEMNLVCGGW